MADNPNPVDRFLAAVLMVGGVLGAGIFLFVSARVVSRLARAGAALQPAQWASLLIVAALLALFVWSVIVGVRFWRRQGRAWKWAAILFAMQVPILTIPGVHYEYYTGIAVQLLGGHAAKLFNLELGSQASVLFGGAMVDVVYGVNLFAVAAVVFLLMRRTGYGKAARPS